MFNYLVEWLFGAPVLVEAERNLSRFLPPSGGPGTLNEADTVLCWSFRQVADQEPCEYPTNDVAPNVACPHPPECVVLDWRKTLRQGYHAVTAVSLASLSLVLQLN